ncbi:hypothetical protein [Helicobacter enhydrae]|nr:hypothetical protein [Helicobacter enhydrae]
MRYRHQRAFLIYIVSSDTISMPHYGPPMIQCHQSLSDSISKL